MAIPLIRKVHLSLTHKLQSRHCVRCDVEERHAITNGSVSVTSMHCCGGVACSLQPFGKEQLEASAMHTLQQCAVLRDVN